MKTDRIKEIRIDDAGKLCITPIQEQFTLIWRSATEVHWDEKKKLIFSPKPREWSYFDWYKHIVNTIKTEYNCELILTDDTVWIDVPQFLKQQIIEL